MRGYYLLAHDTMLEDYESFRAVACMAVINSASDRATPPTAILWTNVTDDNWADSPWAFETDPDGWRSDDGLTFLEIA